MLVFSWSNISDCFTVHQREVISPDAGKRRFGQTEMLTKVFPGNQREPSPSEVKPNERDRELQLT